MNISVTKAAKDWGISRTTIYQKVNDGEISRTADKKIDISEMLRVFGEPIPKKPTERLLNTQNVQYSMDIEHQLALEKLKNEHLSQQVSDQKKLIESYQQQIVQLNKTLDKANASIQNFTQVRLLEFKNSESDYESSFGHKKYKDDSSNTTAEKKKDGGSFRYIFRKSLENDIIESSMDSLVYDLSNHIGTIRGLKLNLKSEVHLLLPAKNNNSLEQGLTKHYL